MKNPPVKLIGFVSAYIGLAYLHNSSRKEGLRMFSYDMVHKYKEESIQATIKTYEQGISLEMSEDSKTISIKT